MENRKFVRIKSDFLTWYQTIDSDSDFSFGKESAKNLSAGGIQMEMEDVSEKGTKLVMKFSIPGYNKEIEVKGNAVWVDRLNSGKFLVGIEFFEISDEDMNAINMLASR